MQYEPMTSYTPSFLIKNCCDKNIHNVKESLRVWCINKGSNETRILIRDDNYRSHEKCSKILYVNCLDPKLRTQAMTYVLQELKNHYSTFMTCKNTSKQENIQYALMLPTMGRTDISTIRSLFSEYGVFEIIIQNDYTTFLNFLQYDDARRAYFDTFEGIVLQSGYITIPVMIQVTRMIDKFEESMLDIEHEVREMGYLDLEFVDSFISDYRSSRNFDMPKYSDEKLMVAISEHLLSKYSFVYDHENFKFGSVENIESTSQPGTSYCSDNHDSEYISIEIEIEKSMLEQIASDEHEFQQQHKRVCFAKRRW